MTTSRSRSRGTAVVRDVLDVVLAELAEHGPEGLSVDRVARRASVNRTTVYRRWPDRDALIAAALARTTAGFAALPDSGSLRADLRAFAIRVIETMDRPEGRAVLRTAMSAEGSTALAQLAAGRVTTGTADAAGDLVARAQTRGEWSSAIPPSQVLFTIVGAVWHRKFLEHAAADDAWLDPLLDLLTAGVASRA